MTEQEVKTFIRSELDKILAEDFRNRITHGKNYRNIKMDTLGLECHVDDALRASYGYFHTHKTMDWATVDDEVQKLLAKTMKPSDMPSEQYADLRQEYVVGMVELLGSLSVRHRTGDHQYKTDYYAPNGMTDARKNEENSSPAKLSSVIDAYIAENTKTSAWKNRTITEYTKQLATLVEVIGDVSVDSIDFPAMRDYKNTLLRYPKHKRNTPALKGKSLHDILQMEGVETISVRRVNTILQTVSSFFNWAERNGYVPKNCAKGLSVRENRMANEERAAFSTEELGKLFTCPTFLHSPQPAYFYAPLLGLFTGARLEELCQLTADDIYQEDGVYIIDINTRNGKSIKTTSSKRKIPLHRLLVEDLAIPRLVEQAKTNESRRIFPDLKAVQGQYGRYVSKRFGDLKKSAGIIINADTGRKDFHSLRHTFATALDHLGVREKMISQLLGHAIQGETSGRYAKPYPMRLLYDEAISKLKYDLDIPTLLRSPHIPK